MQRGESWTPLWQFLPSNLILLRMNPDNFKSSHQLCLFSRAEQGLSELGYFSWLACPARAERTTWAVLRCLNSIIGHFSSPILRCPCAMGPILSLQGRPLYESSESVSARSLWWFRQASRLFRRPSCLCASRACSSSPSRFLLPSDQPLTPRTRFHSSLNAVKRENTSFQASPLAT